MSTRSERVLLHKEGHDSSERRYYLSSRVASAVFFNLAVQGHWGIENKLHWVMDVIFGENKD